MRHWHLKKALFALMAGVFLAHISVIPVFAASQTAATTSKTATAANTNSASTNSAADNTSQILLNIKSASLYLIGENNTYKFIKNVDAKAAANKLTLNLDEDLTPNTTYGVVVDTSLSGLTKSGSAISSPSVSSAVVFTTDDAKTAPKKGDKPISSHVSQIVLKAKSIALYASQGSTQHTFVIKDLDTNGNPNQMALNFKGQLTNNTAYKLAINGTVSDVVKSGPILLSNSKFNYIVKFAAGTSTVNSGSGSGSSSNGTSSTGGTSAAGSSSAGGNASSGGETSNGGDSGGSTSAGGSTSSGSDSGGGSSGGGGSAGGGGSSGGGTGASTTSGSASAAGGSSAGGGVGGGISSTGSSSGNSPSGSNSGSGNTPSGTSTAVNSINGACSPTKNACSAGTSTNPSDNGVTDTWSCTGSNGGTTASCSYADPINGVCSSTKNACTAGTSTNPSDNGVTDTWSCTGSNGGTTASCSYTDPVVSSQPTTTLASHLNGGLTNGGFVGSYYSNSNWTGTASFQRYDVRIDMDWNGMKPGGSNSANYAAVPATGFSVTWNGNLLPAVSGTYVFTGQSAGIMQLQIGTSGQTPSPVFTINSSQLTSGSGTVTLQAGVNYQVTVNYSASSASLPAAHLSWGIQGQAQQILESAIPLGVNINTAYDYDPATLFADAIKESRGFTGAYDASFNNNGLLVPVDSQGWPTTDFLVVPFAGLVESNGTYLLQFNGKAQVLVSTTGGSFTTTAGGNTYSSSIFDNYVPSGVGYNAATNTTTIMITGTYASTASPNLILNFAQTQRTASSATGTGVTNIKLMRPTSPGATTYYPTTTIFNNVTKQAVANFTTLRAMDYLQTNGNAIQHWSDRPTGSQVIEAPSWVTNAPTIGSPLEYLVMFANETGKDVWINIPISADDTYVTNLALLLKYGSDGVNPYTSAQTNPVFPPLQPHLRAYIEYSNEVWNNSFSQFGTNLALSNAEIAAGNSPLNYDAATNNLNQYDYAFRHVAERVKQISDDFRAVWGDAAMNNTIRPVMEWQQGCAYYFSCYYELDFLDSYYDNADGIQHVSNPHPVSYYIWGGGGAWYNTVNNPSASTTDAMYASGQALPTSVMQDAAWTVSYGISDAGYEGSFNIGADNPSSLQLSANLDSRAQADTVAGINYFFANGGGLGLIYTISGASTYGLTDPGINDNTTPKMEAVNQVVSGAMPALVLGNPVTGSTQLYYTAANATSSGSPEGSGNTGFFQLSDNTSWISWVLNVTAPGTYALSTIITGPLNSPPYYSLVTHANPVGDSATYGVYLDGAPLSANTFTLPAGLHSIKIRNASGAGLGVNAITLTEVSANAYP